MKQVMKGRCDMIPVPVRWSRFSPSYPSAAAVKWKRGISTCQRTGIYEEFWSKIVQIFQNIRGNEVQVTSGIRQVRQNKSV